MKMSKRKRKAFNQGRKAGYLEGYAKGLHDGNPFNMLVEAISGMVDTIKNNPELMAEAIKQRDEGLIIEGEDEE